MSNYGSRNRHLISFRFRPRDLERQPALVFYEADYQLAEATAQVDVIDKGYGAIQFLDVQVSLDVVGLNSREFAALRSHILEETKKLYPERRVYTTGLTEAIGPLKEA